jgi:IS5 family transposase
MFMEANECLLAHKDGKGGDGMPPSPRPDRPEEEENQGTLVLDVACVPVDIRYPQDVSLLNEAGEKLETIICRFCKAYGLALPRRYKRKARKNYLNFAKAKEHTHQKVRKAVRKQLGCVCRDIKYLAEGNAPTAAEARLIQTIFELYRQQKYMYDYRVHSVERRIVSIAQPWIRSIVSGKTKTQVESGPKFDMSLDGEGYAGIEKSSFEAYNESGCLQDSVERFKERTGYYSEKVLAEQIYRTREKRKNSVDKIVRLMVLHPQITTKEIAESVGISLTREQDHIKG